ncbi:hypothetical protein DSL72_004085 [Monilinia vaccinii-corymbosi]|uniref:Uncharacterized protein n=1 Tax=Monilinia vaccinii-corymbosi TaxID=61207 RepID=A0A8A3NZK9_9HELO|nr:hypothetical protein DSL72_004085 [Monilinia vaccinii-corymbosi]
MRKILQTQNNILEGQHNHDFNGKIGVSNGGVGDVLYDTDNYEPFELQKLAPIKGSTGIIRKPVGLEHENGDLEKANWRDYHCYENQRGRHVGREKEGFETV